MTDNIIDLVNGNKTYGFIKGEVTSVNEKQVRDYDITELTVKDVTGEIMVSVFGKPNYFHVGDVVDCAHMVVKEFRGQKQCSPKKNGGSVVVIGKASDYDIGAPRDPPRSTSSRDSRDAPRSPAPARAPAPAAIDTTGIESAIDRLAGTVSKALESCTLRTCNKISEVQVAILKQIQDGMGFRDFRESGPPDSDLPDEYFAAMEEEVNGDG